MIFEALVSFSQCSCLRVVHVVDVRFPNIDFPTRTLQAAPFFTVTFIGKHETTTQKKSILAGANVFVLSFAAKFMSFTPSWCFFFLSFSALHSLPERKEKACEMRAYTFDKGISWEIQRNKITMKKWAND